MHCLSRSQSIGAAIQVSTPVTMAGTQQDFQLTPRPLPGDTCEYPLLRANYTYMRPQVSRTVLTFPS